MSDNATTDRRAKQQQIIFAAGGIIALSLLIALLAVSLRGGPQPSDYQVNVRLIAEIDNKLPWSFKPAHPDYDVKLGETLKTSYIAKNLASEKNAGEASFSVSPPEASIYVSKIECFCFRKQELEPGQAQDMYLIFFIDPEIASDPDTKNLRNISFTYSFSEYEES